MTMLDLFIIVAYLAAMLLIGLYFTKRIKNAGDFYVAGRSLGPFVLTATVCATIIGGSAMLGRGAISYTNGVRSVLVALPYLIGMLLFSAISGRIQRAGERTGITSIPQLMEYRFGKWARCLVAAMIGYSMMATVAAQIVAVATISSMIGGHVGITYEMGAIFAACIFMAYTAASGLFGVVYTDVVQFFMLLIFVYIMLPFKSAAAAGGFLTVFRSVPADLLKFRFDGQLFGMIVTNLVFTMAGAEMWQRAFAAKSGKAAVRGMFWGTAVYSLTIFVTLFLGLASLALFPKLIASYGTADAAIPALVIHILPPGLTGLALAGMLSVMMSSADSYLLISTQTFVEDLWKPLRKSVSAKTEIRLSRLLTLFLACGALIIALYIKSAYDALMFAWTFYAASVGLPAVAALFWKKATAPGIIAGVGTGFLTSIVWRLAGEPLGLGSAVPGSAACAVFLVAVSLATCRKHPARMA